MKLTSACLSEIYVQAFKEFHAVGIKLLFTILEIQVFRWRNRALSHIGLTKSSYWSLTCCLSLSSSHTENI